MSGPVEVVLILAAIGYVLVRRMAGEPAQAKRMLLLPVLLCAIGLSDLSGEVKTSMSLVFLVATAAVSVVLGMLRGASVHISQRDGVAFVRYSGMTVVLWVVNLAIKFGANIALGALDSKDAGGVSNSLMLTLGLGILAEGLVVLARALRDGHQVVWAQGQDGAPHRTSPTLDNLRRNLSDRDGYTPAPRWETRRDRIRRRR
ncbi:DUF1453 domain-containing protein [Streptomyces sp. NBC_01497]|uniref:DUF1453 domain-containing protein n=1 Tax=Streptomyces sp. NBC_01497 TaxID=2903885 RepID=UPI002E319D5A|nr:DUF1453 domain-containing protein [Streptomyces sp. NBC_01497]